MSYQKIKELKEIIAWEEAMASYDESSPECWVDCCEIEAAWMLPLHKEELSALLEKIRKEEEWLL